RARPPLDVCLRYLIRSAFTVTWFAGVQSNVPFFLGHTRTNLPFCTCSSTKQGEVTLPPTLDFAMNPSASKLVMFFSAPSRLARVMPLLPFAFTTDCSACWSSMPAAHAYTPRPAVLSLPVYFT